VFLIKRPLVWMEREHEFSSPRNRNQFITRGREKLNNRELGRSLLNPMYFQTPQLQLCITLHLLPWNIKLESNVMLWERDLALVEVFGRREREREAGFCVCCVLRISSGEIMGNQMIFSPRLDSL
jgi:hypothetical protein